MDDPLDLPRAELAAHAEEAIKRMGGNAQVYFKFTCPVCGERCTFSEPNTLWEEGECCNCGHKSPVTKGGYLLVASRPKPFDPERN